MFCVPCTDLYLLRCTEVCAWDNIPSDTIIERNRNGIFDSSNRKRRRLVQLKDFPLLDDDGRERKIYNSNGERIRRRKPIVDDDSAPCGVLVNLKNIHRLFNLYSASQEDDYDAEEYDEVHVDAYPLAFLKTAGNIQANGIPPCFYPVLTTINRSVGKRNEFRKESTEDTDSETDDNAPSARAVKPVSAQFYNYITHRVATRAGQFDSQQGTVTAAISGASAITEKDQNTARKWQSYCDGGLPSERFHQKISVENCPTSCRAEFVYSVDIRDLKDPSGSYVLLSSHWKVFSFHIARYTTISSFHLLSLGGKRRSAVKSRRTL